MNDETAQAILKKLGSMDELLKQLLYHIGGQAEADRKAAERRAEAREIERRKREWETRRRLKRHE